MKKICGVILDWAGTTVDFGCFAPVHAFLGVFDKAGVPATMEEVRRPMGMLKRDHIRTMLEMPRLKEAWKNRRGADPAEADVDELYQGFEPSLMASLHQYADPLPGVAETVNWLREQVIKIGSTTGYTHSMMEVVTAEAAAKGYAPDCWVTPDSVDGKGRPFPYMIFRNMRLLSLSDVAAVVKVGDTVSDIREGVHAGVWSVGVMEGSSQLGLTREELAGLSEHQREEQMVAAEKAFLEAGAHAVIQRITDLPELVERINRCLTEGRGPHSFQR